jgi:nucleoside-diphosphate-sugar epimerase
MSKILVTGGAGFIGSHIVEELIKLNHDVVVLDNLSTGYIENINVNKIAFWKGDIRSKDICNIVTKGINTVFHLAASKSVPKSLTNPTEFNEVNIQGILNLLEACIANKVNRFIFSSSSSVYGDVNEFPQKEDKMSYPISPYALTKLAGEYYCKIFSKHYNLDTISLRYFNVFGEKQPANDTYAGVIPKFITAILNDKNPTVYGNGLQSRDFTYVKNVVNANILALNNKNKSMGEAFNVAGGKSINILELIESINYILNKNMIPVFFEKRKGDILKSQADITQTISKLGYFWEVDFLNGLKKTIDYWKSING